jgi:DHA2 family multidrug resistance protein
LQPAVIFFTCELLGAFLSSLNTRLTTFGLADIRGGMGLGFDEGSWLTTVFGPAQMAVEPSAAWLGTALRTRRFLLWTTVTFAVTSLLVPPHTISRRSFALQLLRGALPPPWVSSCAAWRRDGGSGPCRLRLPFCVLADIAGSIEALHSESGTWQWIFWQNAVFTPLITALVWYAMPREAIGLCWSRRIGGASPTLGSGLGMIYAGLDQSNRLDWLNSGVVSGLFAGGGLLMIAFIATELTVENPLILLRVAAKRKVWVLAVLISIYGFGVLAPAFVLARLSDTGAGVCATCRSVTC